MTDWIVAGTGPRALALADTAVYELAVGAVRAAVNDLHARYGDRLVVMSGMAEGWDTLLAWAALHHRVRLWCAIPNRSYGSYCWGRNSLSGMDRTAEFNRIVAAAWRVTHVMEDIHHTSGLYLNGLHANKVRNQWMADVARQFLVWDAAGSAGTADCVVRIEAAGKPWRDLSVPLCGPAPLPPGWRHLPDMPHATLVDGAVRCPQHAADDAGVWQHCTHPAGHSGECRWMVDG